MPLKDKAVIQAGWDDAPWITAEMKREMYESTPSHLREARSLGRPTLGSGNVYTAPLSDIVVDSFKIPANWKKLYGMDVGWNLTAIMYAAIDPSTNTFYFIDEYYQGKIEPVYHAEHVRAFQKACGYTIPGAIDPAARGRSQVDGRRLIDLYRKDYGLLIVPAMNAVEAGTAALGQAFLTGKVKVFRQCSNFLKEYVGYRRDLNGKILKLKDHACDAARYAFNTQQIARAAPTKLQGTGYGGNRYF